MIDPSMSGRTRQIWFPATLLIRKLVMADKQCFRPGWDGSADAMSSLTRSSGENFASTSRVACADKIFIA